MNTSTSAFDDATVRSYQTLLRPSAEHMHRYTTTFWQLLRSQTKGHVVGGDRENHMLPTAAAPSPYFCPPFFIFPVHHIRLYPTSTEALLYLTNRDLCTFALNAITAASRVVRCPSRLFLPSSPKSSPTPLPSCARSNLQLHLPALTRFAYCSYFQHASCDAEEGGKCPSRP